MKVSELIIQLKELKEAYGNLEVKDWVSDDDAYGITVEVTGACVSADEHGRDYIEIT